MSESRCDGRYARAAIWQRVAAGVADDLLARASALPDAPGPAGVQALRAAAAPLADAVLDAAGWAALAQQLSAARRRAASRLADAGSWLLDRDGLEQASSTAAAQHKARRYARLRGRWVVDLCCGVGGDARELVRTAGCRVIAVDRDPQRAVMTAHNAGCPAVVADVASWPTDTVAGFHLDPARRSAGRRQWRPEDFTPGPDVVARWIGSGLPGAVKLGPGADLDALPWVDGVEVEVLGDRRRLQQAVLWCGAFAGGAGLRRATCLRSGRTLSGEPRRPAAGDGSTRQVLAEPHPAVERAGLVGSALAGRAAVELAPGLGLVTAAAPLADRWFRDYEVLAELPAREGNLRRWLRQHDGGVVAVKTRGGAADAGALQHALRGAGATPFTVFVLRVGDRRRALVTRALDADQSAGSA